MKFKKIILTIYFLLFLAASVNADLIERLKFKDADIKIVLQAVVQGAVRDGKNINIIVAPNVEGKVSVDLEKVDWQTALEALLKAYNYGYEWVGKSIILVDTLENLTEKRKQAAQARGAEAVETRIYTFNFAKVKDVKETIEKMLTSQGRLTFDERTNTIVITDTQTSLEMLESALESLDTVTPQVLISAKIIETDLDMSEKIGIKWNMTLSLSGAKRPHIWPFTATSGNKYLPGTFPATTASNFTYGTIDASSFTATLDLILSDTGTKILSMPEITTVDNNQATIDVVREDPIPNYTYNSETGQWEISGFEWKKYGVTLDVTPQINKAGYITLIVKPKVSEKVSEKTFSSASGISATLPILDTQTTTTKVMVRSGDTMVIAGLVKDKTESVDTKVPFLGDLPLVGKLFKHKYKTVKDKNLMIFITPTIVTAQTQLVKQENQ